MNTLSEWLEYIEQSHSQEIDMGLSRITKVATQLSIDFTNKLVVTVAGTNGKGSTCRFIEQALVNKRISVGVYSSPHMILFNERIRVDGTEVNDQLICDGFSKVKNTAATADNGKPISLTYFEYATLCALLIFLQSNVEVCILEVGLGGRLDATNIIDADIGVITSIGLDHQDYLGNTLSEIAAEKAGIIKPLQSVVIGYDQPQQSLLDCIGPRNLVLQKGREFDLVPVNHSKNLEGYLSWDDKEITIDLSKSRIPQQNVMTAIAALVIISKRMNQTDKLLTNALVEQNFLQNLVASVSMPGRFEVCHQEPLVILDVAHNAAAAELVVQQAKKVKFDSCFIVIGMLKDKNIIETMKTLNQLNPIWLCIDLPGSRSASKEVLAANAEFLGQPATTFNTIKQAYASALEQAKVNDLVLVLGSFVVASEFKLHCEQLKGLTA